MKAPGRAERRAKAGFGDPEAVAVMLGAEAGLSRSEALLYMRLLQEGSIPSDEKGPEIDRLLSEGMAILSGDGRRFIPVHPRLAVANHFRTWRDRLLREMNDRRMKTDKLILELIPVYEAAMEKRLAEEAGTNELG